MHPLGVRAHLAADHALGERMGRVTGDRGQAAVRNGDVERARGRTIVGTHGAHESNCRLAPMAITTVEIPVLDLGPYLAGDPGADTRTAAALRHALEHVGFYFVVNHPVPLPLIAVLFAGTRRVHELPLDDKLALRLNRHNIGYLPVASSVSRASTIDTVKKPNVVEALFLKRDRPADHPDVVAGVLFRGLNQWPARLPGFRDKCLEY